MITKKKIKNGIKEHLIEFTIDPNMGSGTVCKIGDGWFYFGGSDAEEHDPEEFLKIFYINDIINEIYDTLESFRKNEECKDEYEYYDYVLTYYNGY